MTEPAKLRLFFAVALPAQQLDWLDERCRAMAEQWPEARWTSAGGRHITLQFLGATDRALVGAIGAVGARVAAAHEPAPGRLGGLGVFPSLRRARVLWAGLEDHAGLLPSLAGALNEGLAELGFEAEKRRFSPHVTLARFRTPARVEALPELRSPPPAFEIGSFALWRSLLSPKGASYELLQEFPLGAGSAS